MLVITLPDQTKLEFADAISVLDIAKKIGSSLAKAALAGEINGKLVDLNYQITKDAAVKIITAEDKEGLDVVRHSTAHLLAHAAKQLFPDIKIAIGPVIEHGFYYDFDFEDTFTPEILAKLEKQMQKLVKQNLPITRKVVSKQEAIALFKKLNEPYKVEILSALAENETVTLYQQGDFIDPCRGPHVPNTNKLQAFKLTKIAGAYWRGDSNNKMLQRVYGTAWQTKQLLDEYLAKLEEAKKRDHRLLGKHMDLFHFQEEAPGMAFWHNNGWFIYQTIIQYMRSSLQRHSYQEVATPIFMDRGIWETSGHWEKFAEHMFIIEAENRVYAAKPMNCPGNIQIFNQGVKSYRDLPLRIGEFGVCHRNEASGTLLGLMRIRQFTQDDAHIYCTEEQLITEIDKLIDLVYETYDYFGFKDVLVRLATRPEKRIGNDEDWDRAEQALQLALDKKGIKWELAPGEGAFYGPKHEFHLRDSLDRVWQCGTIQVDFAMPKRLGAQYVAEDGTRKTPIMIHRAILGSIERFIGILLEHYNGVLPLKLAPVQVVIMNITDSQVAYTQIIEETLKKQHIRVKLDLRNEKIGFKIRQHSIARIPYLLVIGEQEVEQQLVTVRTQDGKDLGTMKIADFIDLL